MHRFELVVFVFLSVNHGITFCKNRCEFHERHTSYYKVRDCYKSSIPIIAWTRTSRLEDCLEFARQRGALAVNFSPDEASNLRNFSQNCQALGCPETEDSSTLVADVAFDYYSAYGNLNITEKLTCINSLGLFGLIEDKQNYTESIEKCQDIGADLANIISEVRTNHLSHFINATLQDWYRVAYVDINDINEEGAFTTRDGSMLSCFRYRAWAPGHPTSKHRNEDCVVLDSDRMWRVVKCSSKLPALCEFRLSEPMDLDSRNATYDSVSNKSKNQTCNSIEMKKGECSHNNSTRMDKCSSVYKVFGTKSNNTK